MPKSNSRTRRRRVTITGALAAAVALSTIADHVTHVIALLRR
ncbi:hypothetical protein [Allobranchiibius sp. GilTou73]|nr:hypothetical protein [Allobranchiibius sp. GilTou73]